MVNVERHSHCLTIIEILRKRCASLNQWFEQVIDHVLVVDYLNVKADFDKKSKELKLERIKLLQEKIAEKTGQTFDINLYSKYNKKIIIYIISLIKIILF